MSSSLKGLRVLDLTTSFGYASKLFVDLGAEVTLVEPRNGGDNTMVQNALLSLSLMGGQSVVRNVASKVGIQDLQMGTSGSGQTTEVQVSGYLSRRTYLQYGISMFQPVNTLTLRYRLRDNLFLEAVSGLASALDLLYTFEF